MALMQGGTAAMVSVQSSGWLSCGEGASIGGLALSSGARTYFLPGTTLADVTVSSGAVLSCNERISASGVSVLQGGQLYANSGAKCLDVAVESGGIVVPYVLGHDEDTVLTGSGPGGEFSVSNGTASGFRIRKELEGFKIPKAERERMVEERVREEIRRGV
ncbi:MAG: hypothetical protein IJS15_12360, partial [Victivallales bacterium]|nr:hypothetical protein [Victivallales bacterium]